MWKYLVEEYNGKFIIIAKIEGDPFGTATVQQHTSTYRHVEKRVWDDSKGWLAYTRRNEAKLYSVKGLAEQAISSGEIPQPAS